MANHNLVPVPAHLEEGNGALPLAGVTVRGPQAGLLASELGTLTGSDVPVATGEPVVSLAVAGGGVAGSYELAVTPDGATVTGADRAGLRYGIFTLVQLARRAGEGWELPAVAIQDAPRFGYRGVMLDTARHFFDVATVKRVIDRAARLKLNVLHLHLTDDQGWRIEIESRPELTRLASGTGVFSDEGGYYTQADFAEIVAHAADNDMTVVPEIDLPGHTHAISLAYPDLMEEPQLLPSVMESVEAYGGDAPVAGEPYRGMAVGFSSVRIGHEPTYGFLADVLGELAAMTPGPWLHVGGDECHGTDRADYVAFINRVTAMVAGLGKTPMLWHEAGAADALASGSVGQFWGLRRHDGDVAGRVRAFPAAGGKVVLSPADAAYLDMKYDAHTPIGLVWADGPTSVERSYDWEPDTLVEGLAEEDLLGVEAPLWTETVTDLAAIDTLMFPRIASVAEHAWSPASGAHPARTWESFAGRVGGLAPLWEAQGIGFHRSPEITWADA